jgi:hypothetical protein
MLSFFEWLGNTRWSIALIESLYVWSFLEAAHVITLGLFVGTVVMMDLRLLGVSFRRVPASEFTGRILPWTRGAFVVMTITGLLLFYSSPLRYYQNFFFRVKLLMLLVAGLNVWLFHSRIHKRVSEWDLDRSPPRAARVAAVVSLVAWACVVVAGRLTAYNWFDCWMQPQPAFINWAAGCVLDPE